MGERAEDIQRIRREAREWLAYLQSDEVTPEGQLRFQTWLRRSELHAQAYQRVESLWCGIAQLTDLAALEPLDQPAPGERLRAALGQAGQKVGYAFLRFGVPVTAAAAGIILLVLGFKVLPRLTQPPTPLEYATGVAELRDVRLPDGSIVNVGARSKIEVSFSRQDRRVALAAGQAFFSVRTDPARPFYVAASNTLVRVTGTKFEVSRQPDNVRTAVLEGVVEVARLVPGSNASADNVIAERHWVTAGQQVVADPSGIRHTRGAEPGAWRKGRLSYVDARLDEVIADANRYHDKTILLGAKDLAALRVTAAYRTDQIDMMLASLLKTYPIEMEYTDDGRIILKPRRG